jgi:phosphoglycolate phosphatase-like HAD superfamily hydrolase
MKTALFDLDGTLIDSLEDIALGINLTRQDFGLALLPTAEITEYSDPPPHATKLLLASE